MQPSICTSAGQPEYLFLVLSEWLICVKKREEFYLATNLFNKYLTCQLLAKSYKENHFLERDLL